MIEVPLELQQKYPCDGSCIPSRPWWTFLGNLECRRNDGVITWRSRIEQEDRGNPALHPGFRVGQVWAGLSVDGSVMFVSQIVDFDPDDEKCWVLGTSRMPEAELVDLLDHAILLADPCCPHKAPWSTVREG